MEINSSFQNYQYACQILDEMLLKKKNIEEAIKDAEDLVEKAKTDILLYMNTNGVVSEEISLGSSTYRLKKVLGKPSVDVPDLEAVPAEFVRERIIKTPDKIKIKEHLLANKVNWASIKAGNDTISYELISLTNEDGSLIRARG